MSTRGTLAVIAAIAFVSVATLLVLGHHADRLVVDGRRLDRIELQANTFTASTQSHISLDMDAYGNVVAAWDSRRQDFGTYGVFARWVDASGFFRGPETQVNLERRSLQINPAVTVGDDGSAWFAWESFGQDGELGGIMSRSTGDEHAQSPEHPYPT